MKILGIRSNTNTDRVRQHEIDGCAKWILGAAVQGDLNSVAAGVLDLHRTLRRHAEEDVGKHTAIIDRLQSPTDRVIAAMNEDKI